MEKVATSDQTTKYFTLKDYGKPLQSIKYEHRKVFNAPWFQGSKERDNYFEGWYFKNVSADGQNVWSFIPGVSLVKNDSHSFVQAINGQTGETFYFRYPAQSFSFSSEGFEVCIGNSYFSDKMVLLDLDDGVNRFRGELHISESTTYPSWYKRPGIMGWYRYAPFMECYHGVVSLDHALQGSLQYNDQSIRFDAGRGYIEKDWGSSMPKAWIWMQTNHFETQGTSFMLSVARIPWVGNTFTGFLGFFLHKGKTLSFATYTGARITSIETTENDVQITIKGKSHIINIWAKKSPKENKKAGNGGLKAPVLGNMERIIHESIDAEISLQILNLNKEIIFSGTGKHSGFEMVGDMALLK